MIRSHVARAAAALAAVLAAAPAPAEPERTGREIYDEQLRLRLDQQAPDAREVGFDAGGWFHFALFVYDDPTVPQERALRKYQLRGWASLNVQAVHRAYVRGLLNWDGWNEGDNPAGRGDDFDEQIERAWYQFDLGQLVQNATGERPAFDFRMKVGREFATIGTALALSMPLDMVQFDARLGHWQLMALLGKPSPHTRNLDDSLWVAHHQDRCLFGAELAYTGLPQHRLFAYFLYNEDHTGPSPPDSAQRYDYSSRYVGVGSEGTLLTPALRYQWELVGEWGRTYSDGVSSGGQDDICAMALDVLMEYLCPRPTRPRVSFEYLYASGDADRSSSATSTVGGNRAGTTDGAFNAFGFRDTGIAFSPRISNLSIYILGASFFPLERLDAFRNMEVGTKLFFYHKSAASGAISDTTATNNAQWVGWEWDAYCDWRLTSDLAWTVRYGAFFPGSAYNGSDKSCRQFLYTGVVFSF